MAHGGVIDPKSLREYKELLKIRYGSDLLDRVDKLEALIAEQPKPEDTPPPLQPDDGRPQKYVQQRSAMMAFTLEQLALSRLESERKVYFDRGPEIHRENVRLQFDALRQDDSLPADLVVEVHWLRKRFLDGPVWVRQIDAKVELYELMTGRKGKGLLVFVVPNESMKMISDLPYTSLEIVNSSRQPEVIIYTYAELAFNPGAMSAALFTSNIANGR
eukprot:TRINITY_DN2700_c1_g1_i8.p1 TRINITY_DN2700_c1_g1~~TRINITY_DN2700_c1_g1_i8.p1  ORF type:complete len:217 (+),score=29.45 TRINITY_DN2700_c1_g1_i8:818-1468(+)